MIKTKQSAVTAVSYGLIAALVVVVSLGALTATGVDIENIFSISGSAMSATTSNPSPSNQIGSPNANLSSEQQSEITNAAAEIAAGTASAACLQSMNNSANAASMASMGATCLGPGLNIAPPQQPIKAFFGTDNYPFFTYPNGQIYVVGLNKTVGATSLNASGLWFYNDGFLMNNYNWAACSPASGYAGFYSPTTTTTTQGGSASCTGGTNTGGIEYIVDNTNISQSAPLGYAMNYTW